MTISLFGLGYVGCVTAACLARKGFSVIGVDVNPTKVEAINDGRTPILELDLAPLIRAGVEAGRLSATIDGADAIRRSELSVICVGTPGNEDGTADLRQVNAVCREIGRAMAAKPSPHPVILRSTVPPGTTNRCREILESETGDRSVPIAFNPEFLREGSAIQDFENPPYTLLGCDDPVAEDAARLLYADIPAPIRLVAPEEAELVKAASNAWHATKIVFANEVGRLAKALGLDGRRIMDLIRQDTKLNLSPAYLSPGFAYGGSCLPKDVRSLLASARAVRLELPLHASLAPSNDLHIEAAAQQIIGLGVSTIGLVGLAFKPGTDDVRESPSIALAKRLAAEGIRLIMYDPMIRGEALIGSNREYAAEHFPQLADVLTSSEDELLGGAEAIVLAHNDERLHDLVGRIDPTVPVVDLAGLCQSPPPSDRRYDGSCW